MDAQQDDTAPESTPLWRAIADVLRAEILAEHYPPGTALPGEVAMAARYHTSRPTVRRAIFELAGEGLLSAAQGRGTFVRARPDRRLILITGTTHIDLLGAPHATVDAGWWPEDHPDTATHPAATDAVITPATRDHAEVLRIRTGEPILYRFQYWRHRRTQRVIALTSVTPAHLIGNPAPGPIHGYTYDVRTAAQADADDHAESALYHALAEHGPVTYTTSVNARMPRSEELDSLGTEPATPLLVIRRTMTDPHGRPLEATTIEAPADRIEALTADPGASTPGAILTL
ncbi:MAG: GntR family transcriptional regulator [Actinocrinis sp.]